ncbi:MAG: hypothetical protein ACRC62_04870 [Microcoleus sp.]
MGLPVWLAYLLDGIYEGLPVEQSKQFNLDWPNAIPEGSDLSKVKYLFLEWLLIDPEHGVIRFNNDLSISKVAALLRATIDGKIISEEEWAAAGDAAWDAAGDAAGAAWDAAGAAAGAARDAARDAARGAARGAGEAAWAAARAARDAARGAARGAAWDAAREAQAKKILELLSNAPVPKPIAA